MDGSFAGLVLITFPEFTATGYTSSPAIRYFIIPYVRTPTTAVYFASPTRPNRLTIVPISSS